MSSQTRTQPTDQTFPPLGDLLRKRRRGLSLKMLMLAVLVVGGGLGWIVHKAHVQREAVAAILKAGGRVQFDWEDDRHGLAPGRPGWLRTHLGPGFFEEVTYVDAGITRDDPI